MLYGNYLRVATHSEVDNENSICRGHFEDRNIIEMRETCNLFVEVLT